MKGKRWSSLKRCAVALLAPICVAGFVATGHAGTTTGQISTIAIVAGAGGAPGSLDFRVFLVGNPVICNGNYFAYVNVSDSNYNAIAANVLSARAMSAPISLTWAQQSNGYCELTSIQW